jgi:hypothetical protein
MKRSAIVKKLDSIFSQFIRLRNSDHSGTTECFTCGKRDHWKKLQNGHFQSRRHYSTRWDETNCQVQCSGCNVFRFGEQYQFGLNLNTLFKKNTAEKLLKKSRETVKYTDDELLLLITKYKNHVDDMI